MGKNYKYKEIFLSILLTEIWFKKTVLCYSVHKIAFHKQEYEDIKNKYSDETKGQWRKKDDVM